MQLQNGNLGTLGSMGMGSMGEQIQSLKNNFIDYLFKFEVKTGQDSLEFEYIPWTFELIDKDMDVDEFHYDGIMRTFEKFLKNEIIELLKTNDNLKNISIKKYTLISREQVIFTNLYYVVKFQNEKRLHVQDSAFKSIHI